MRLRTLLAAASVVAIAAAGYHYLAPDNYFPPMDQAGTTTRNGPFVRRETVDYEAVITEALSETVRFLTLTVTRQVVRDENLATSIRYLPLPSSRGRVRVLYRAEYPIGYDIGPGKFNVSGGSAGLVITLHRPRVVARPSVKLLSYKVLESGFLIDEESAIIELQQRIQPEAERLSATIARRDYVIPRSERVLRRFLQPLLAKAANGAAPPPITFRYE